MYLKNIAIKNIGPISELNVELPFNENGLPKPIIFVGENGSGKTILQSHIADSFYEIGSKLFQDVAKMQGLNRSYYKISGGINLQISKDKGFSSLVFMNDDGGKIEYLDKIGEVKKEDITSFLPDFSLSPNGLNDNERETTNIENNFKFKLQEEWLSGSYFYQPAYRYEEPFWKNTVFNDYQRFEEKIRFSDNLDKEIEIISSSKDNKNYLLDLVLDFTNNPKNPIDQFIWSNINNILREIKQRKDIRFGIGPRGAYRVAIGRVNEKNEWQETLLPSIDSLSLGESILLNLFVNIIRHGDNPPKPANEIKGIVSIDEIDVHLHSDLQNTILPELIALFPKIQFIITTHSPLFLLGMERKFGIDGFQVRNMPSGEIITTERFSEFGKAYEILEKTERFELDLKKQTSELKMPKLFVEGPTDEQYIKHALQLFKKTDILEKIEIEIIGERTKDGTKGSNNIALKNAASFFKVHPDVPGHKILLLGDPGEGIQSASYGNNIFVRQMPDIEENPIKKGIENLFSNQTITSAQNANEECFETIYCGKKIMNIKIVDGKKKNISDWICQNASEDDFSNFKSIFSIIEETLLVTA